MDTSNIPAVIFKPDKKEQMMSLLHNMLSTHEQNVLAATEELVALCADPECVVDLCKILNSEEPFDLRQCAANLLSMRLLVPANWEAMPAQAHADIETALFGALETLVRDDNEKWQQAIIRNVGLVMELERSGGEWTEAVFDYVEATCLSTNMKTQQLGALIYSSLSDVAPNVFVQYMERGQRIFVSSLQLAEEQGSLVTPFTDNLLAGLTRALPLGHKHLTDTKELEAVLPLAMRTATAFAYLPYPDKCTRGFDLMSNLLQYVPELMFEQLQSIMEQLLLLAEDRDLSAGMRVKALVFIRRFLAVKRREIVRLKLLDRFLWMVFGIFSVEPECDLLTGEEIYLDADRDLPTPLSKATEALAVLVSQSDANKIAGRVLRLLRPQLEQQPTSVQRVGVHLTLAVLSESFTDTLEMKYLQRFVSICHTGVYDDDSMVRRAAFFSMSVMVDNLLPEITLMADKIMPLFGDFLEHIPESQRRIVKESKTNERMFFALENYVDNVKPESLKPYMPKLMPLLLSCTQPEINSPSLRQMALSAVAKLGETMKTLLAIYFDDILAAIKPLLIQTQQEEELLLRAQAIHICGALNSVNPSKFASIGPWILEFIMEMIESGTDTQFYTYNLLGIISGIVPDKFENHFPLILKSLVSNINEPDSKRCVTCVTSRRSHATEADSEADSQSGDYVAEVDEDDETSESSATVSIASVDGLRFEREEAMQCMKSFAHNLPDLVKPHLDRIVRLLLRCFRSEHSTGSAFLAACQAICACIQLNWRSGHSDKAKKLSSKILPTIVRYTRETDDTEMAIASLKCIEELLVTLKAEAFYRPGHVDKLYNLLRNGLRRKLTCQNDEGVSSDEEDDNTIRNRRQREQFSVIASRYQLVTEVVGEVLVTFGQCMRPQQFARYFEALSSRYMRQLRKLHRGKDVNERRSLVYFVLTRCVRPLSAYAEGYLEMLCKGMVYSIGSGNPRVRQHGMLSLNELLDLGLEEVVIKTSANALVKALLNDSVLSVSEKEQLCGDVSRMIRLDRHNICELDQLMPALMANLPLRRNFNAYNHFCAIFKEKSPEMEPYVPEILRILMESLTNDDIEGSPIATDAIAVLKCLLDCQPRLYSEALIDYPGAALLI